MRACLKSSTRNWESDHVRPDVIAFRELDGLVRKLTEQLAGYRRRALSAESRTRELEQELAVLNAALAATRAEAAASIEAKEHALAAAREATAAASAAREALSESERSSGEFARAVPGPAGAGQSGAPDADAALEENARLRARLADARERTVQLTDRVRFLRQQLTQGAER